MKIKIFYILVIQLISYQYTIGQNLVIEIHTGEIMGNPRSFPSMRLYKNIVYNYYDNNNNLIKEYHIRSKLSNKGIIRNYCKFDSTKPLEHILYFYINSYDSGGKLTQRNLYFSQNKESRHHSDEKEEFTYNNANRILKKNRFYNLSDTNIYQYYMYYYDTIGNLIRIDEHTSNDSIFERRHFYYNSNNLLIEKKRVKVQSLVTERDFYFYDNFSRLIKSTTKDPFSYSTYYKYNKAGKLIEEKCYCEGKWLDTVKYIYRKCTSANST